MKRTPEMPVIVNASDLQSHDIWGEHLICYGLDIAETKNACKISLKGKIGLGGTTIVLKTSQARIDVYALSDMDLTERNRRD